ncbi:hypothetical protein CTAYLR_007475 [Chrysophaeum taylorii]|uniref:C3H1-type domain-containing protein n=1 Tax=Chrysophaeum taylorii TaxID=2483200 RepID=A0AAD7XKM1_9STRA|nr:hypothetical protein CTAYLR_007475 [Chrysophaeum taylorii]
MGVPAFYKWLEARYPAIVVEECEVDNLYVDCNGVVHPCCHPEGKPQPKNEEEMVANVTKALDEIVERVKPKRLVYLALDGVAPRAKMNQQRKRRFCAARDAEEMAAAAEEVRARSVGREFEEQRKRWDHNAITPGTEFMAKLGDAMRDWAESVVVRDPSLRVVLSDSGVPGEGEHKLVAHLRASPAPSVVVGMDADLVFLCLVLHNPRLFVLREKRMVSIQRIRECLRVEFEPDDLEQFVDDFVLLCIFVGNDFLPPLPALSIPDGGLDLLLVLYERQGLRLTEEKGSAVIVPNVAGLLGLLAVLEPEILRRQRAPTEPPLAQQEDFDAIDSPESFARMVEVRARERSIIPTENLRLGRGGFRARYHKKINYEPRMCEAYIRGILFVSNYYRGLTSWSWYYPYHYAPLADDLRRANAVDDRFDLGRPVAPLVQLVCVLPVASRHCVPRPAQRLMSDDPFDLDPNGKPSTLKWLWVVLLPFADVPRVAEAVKKIEPHLSAEERLRNTNHPNPVLFSPYSNENFLFGGRCELRQTNFVVSEYVFRLRRGRKGIPPPDPRYSISAKDAALIPKRTPRLPASKASIDALDDHRAASAIPENAPAPRLALLTTTKNQDDAPPPPPEAPILLRRPPQDLHCTRCRYFAQGYCMRGAACFYAHY